MSKTQDNLENFVSEKYGQKITTNTYGVTALLEQDKAGNIDILIEGNSALKPRAYTLNTSQEKAANALRQIEQNYDNLCSNSWLLEYNPGIESTEILYKSQYSLASLPMNQPRETFRELEENIPYLEGTDFIIHLAGETHLRPENMESVSLKQ